MKIGIMTCWQPDDNYGTQLQCFAFQQYLKNKGHDVYLIQYLRENDTVMYISFDRLVKIINPYRVLKKIISILKKKRQSTEISEHNREAPSFRQKYLNLSKVYYSYKDLQIDPPIADLYIVGSDQVWFNNPLQHGQFNSFFLNFGNEKTKRISYAASFGFDKTGLPRKFMEKAIPLLKNFDGLSVREDSGLTLIEDFGLDNAVKVSDPTLLLDAAYYRKIYNENNFSRQNRKFVLLYNLSSKSNINCIEIKKWSERQSLDFVYISGHGQYDNIEKCYATIPQWLYLRSKKIFLCIN